MATAKAASPKGGIGPLTAYCVKTKKKNVPMLKAKISVTKGRFVAVGVDAEGNKMSVILNRAGAEAHIAAKHAIKGEGWDTLA